MRASAEGATGLESSSGEVLNLDKVSAKSVVDLIHGRILAVRIPFLPAQACRGIVATLLQRPRKAYTHEIYEGGRPVYLHYGVDRIGTPFNTTYHQHPDSPAFTAYHRDAHHHMRMMERVCRPFGGNPILRLIEGLHETYPHGAAIAEFHGRKMFSGIIRIMEPHLEGKERLEDQPHFDSLPPGFHPIHSQLSANIYLAVPDAEEENASGPAGGELELWDVPPVPASDIESFSPDTDWRSRLPESHRIVPRLGELILINTRRPHAVRVLRRGQRISLQTFIGYLPDEKLLCWN